MYFLQKAQKLIQTKREMSSGQNPRILKVKLSVHVIKLCKGVVIWLHSFLACAM
jgi:hypothetical protein